jgi:hypothetical protein
MWFGEPHPFPARGSPTRLSKSGQQSYTGWSCRTPSCKNSPLTSKYVIKTTAKWTSWPTYQHPCFICGGSKVQVSARTRICWQFIVVLFSPFWYSPRHFLKLVHDHFISRPFEYTIFFSFFPSQSDLKYLLIVRCRRLLLQLNTHTHTHTHGKTSLDERSANRRDLNPTKHSPHNRQLTLFPAVFEPAIPVRKKPQTYALDRVANGTGRIHNLQVDNLSYNSVAK